MSGARLKIPTRKSETARAAEGGLAGGAPRSPYRERLQLLLSGDRPRSTLLVGPPQADRDVGLTTDQIQRFIGRDDLELDAANTYLTDWLQRFGVQPAQ